MGKKVAFITGATSGIGGAFACHFAQKGYDLIITGHPDDKIPPCIEQMKEKYNASIEIIFADLAKENDIARVEEIIKREQKIEILINSAGFTFWKPFWMNNVKELESMIKVHISAPVRFIYAALPKMIVKKKGVIINLSSLSSFMPVPKDSMYSATKLFHNSFMESLHCSVKDKGIKVQVLCPGFVYSNFHKRAGLKQSDLKNGGIIRWMQPEKVVEISVRNLKKKNKVIVVPGWRNKLIKFIVTNLPRSLYYTLATKFLQ